MSTIAIPAPRRLYQRQFVRPSSVRVLRLLDLPLYAFVASIPFETFGSQNGQALNATITWALGIVWTFCCILDPRVKLRRFPSVLIAMTLLAVVYYGLSLPIDPSLRNLANHFSLLLLQMTIMIWLLIGDVAERPYLYRNITWVYAASCGVVSFLQLLGLANHVVDAGRIAAIGEDPNTWCGKLAVGLVMAMGAVWGRHRLSFPVVLLLGFLCATIIPSAMLSGSRTGLAALIVGIAVLTASSILSSRGASRLRRVLLVTLLIGLLVSAFRTSVIMEARWWQTLSTGDLAYRQFLYPEELRMIIAKPLFGWGPIENNAELCEATGSCAGIRSTENTFGWALTSLGFLGAAPFLYVIGLAIRSAWRMRRSSLGWGPLATLCTALTVSCGVEWYHVKVYWLILGLTIAVTEKPKTRRRVWVLGPVHRDNVF